MSSFRHLFSPISIGSMQLKNRVVMSPMTTDYGNIEQEPSERLIAYLEERAKGGVGLITVEVCSVALDHRYQANSLSLAEDRFIPLHRRITDILHKHDVKVQPQITHPGPESLAPFFENKPGIGPSVNVNPGALQSCRPLELDEIPAVVQQYVQTALRAKEAGYDGMELHAAHAYMLLGSFLSPLRNGRSDDYGGKKLSGRARLLIETLSAVKAAVGDDFPVTVSLSGYERYPGGREINESQQLAQLLVDAGADAFRVSGGATDRLVTQMVMGSDYPDGINVTAAEAIKQVVDVPVMVVGRIHTPEHAEQILADGQADLTAMGRPFLADPHWPNKAKAGHSADIRRCISCENCIDSMIDYQNMNCAVNAGTGREYQQAIKPCEEKKHVVVIGGGPAGMEAARVADLRGHRVTLLERQRRLGGSLVLASTVHSDNEHFLQWLKLQVQKSSIDVRLGTDASADTLKTLQADTIIVATGAQVLTPDIPGQQLPHVFSGAQMRRIVEGHADSEDFSMLPTVLQPAAKRLLTLLSARLTPALLRKASKAWMPLGKRVVIVGADLAALELAEFVAKRGRKVSILESQKRIAREIGPKRRTEHTDRLDKLGVTINTEVQCKSIDEQSVQYRSTSGSTHRISADTVILAGDPVANTSLFEEVKDIANDTHAIGDCTGLGLIRKATDDAMRIACAI
ncbi:MAG: FAD-dependent oxidoreductase [Pseudomonadales bacterium]